MEKALLDRSILDATSQVWKLALGFDLSPGGGFIAATNGEKVFCVRINLCGSWRAQVIMQLPWELGEFAAWRIMGMNESESPSLHQISVVLKEVASAMADTIKVNMPQPCEAEDAKVEIQAPRLEFSNAVVKQVFKGPWGHSIVVTILESETSETVH